MSSCGLSSLLHTGHEQQDFEGKCGTFSVAGYRPKVGDWVMVHRYERASNRRCREGPVVVVILATLRVTKPAARTREGVDAVESMLPHVREDLFRDGDNEDNTRGSAGGSDGHCRRGQHAGH